MGSCSDKLWGDVLTCRGVTGDILWGDMLCGVCRKHCLTKHIHVPVLYVQLSPWYNVYYSYMYLC